MCHIADANQHTAEIHPVISAAVSRSDLIIRLSSFRKDGDHTANPDYLIVLQVWTSRSGSDTGGQWGRLSAPRALDHESDLSNTSLPPDDAALSEIAVASGSAWLEISHHPHEAFVLVALRASGDAAAGIWGPVCCIMGRVPCFDLHTSINRRRDVRPVTLHRSTAPSLGAER